MVTRGGTPNIEKSIFSALYRNMLWIAPPLMCVAVLLLGLSIRNVVRLVKGAKILSVPLVEQQTIEFREAGKVVLCLEGPQLTTRFARLSYELSTDDGTPVEGRTAWFRARTTGVSWVRMELRSYEIPRPGRYVLCVQGLGAPQERDAKHHLVFMRPHLFPSIGYVIGMLFSFGLFIVSLLLFIGRLTGWTSES
jgi:hypothetical protein